MCAYHLFMIRACVFFDRGCIHTYIHMHKYIHMNTCIHTHTNSYVLTRVRKYSRPNQGSTGPPKAQKSHTYMVYIDLSTCIYAHIHPRRPENACIRKRGQESYIHGQIRICILLIYVCVYIYVDIHIHTYIHACMHTGTHMHTYIHTNKQPRKCLR